MAEKLGEDAAAKLLSQTLQEEKDTDVKLSDLADKMTIEDSSDQEAENPKTRSSKGRAAKA